MSRKIIAGTFAALALLAGAGGATPASARTVIEFYQSFDGRPPPGDCWQMSHSEFEWHWACRQDSNAPRDLFGSRAPVGFSFGMTMGYHRGERHHQ